jgi:hypothetical protein
VLTAAGGLALLTLWVRGGGVSQQQDGLSRFPLAVVLGHGALAAALLAVWVVSLATDAPSLRWVALVGLLVVALLGFTLFARWLPQVRHREPVVWARGGAGGGTGVATRSAESTFPVPVVVVHGVLGAATLVLVLLAALAS